MYQLWQHMPCLLCDGCARGCCRSISSQHLKSSSGHNVEFQSCFFHLESVMLSGWLSLYELVLCRSHLFVMNLSLRGWSHTVHHHLYCLTSWSREPTLSSSSRVLAVPTTLFSGATSYPSQQFGFIILFWIVIWVPVGFLFCYYNCRCPRKKSQ